MDAITHTLIAGTCMTATYFWGRYLAKREILESAVEYMLTSLEKDGFIRTVEDENGDRELVPISEIIANSTRFSRR